MAVRASDDIEDYFILDVRDSEEYELQRIEGSFNIPARMILVTEYPGSSGLYLKKIPKDKKILVYCSSGRRAALVESVLIKNGFEVLNILKYEYAEDFVNSLRRITPNER